MIVFFMGKSASGKDTLFREIRRRIPELIPIVPCTTRPLREGEKEGREYHFCSEEEYASYLAAGEVIETRVYKTALGDWRYFSLGSTLEPEKRNYLVIGTLEAYAGFVRYFGKDKLLPVMIELEDGERLTRALEREKSQKTPSYEELCRRFLADQEDFSEEEIRKADIPREARFENNSLEECAAGIEVYIREKLFPFSHSRQECWLGDQG